MTTASSAKKCIVVPILHSKGRNWSTSFERKKRGGGGLWNNYKIAAAAVIANQSLLVIVIVEIKFSVIDSLYTLYSDIL
jgi:hypothetical protein